MSGWWLPGFVAISVALQVGRDLLIQSGYPMYGQLARLADTGLGIVQFAILAVMSGQPGPNRFGPNPLEPAGAAASRYF